MPQTIHSGIKALIDEANAQIETLSAADAIKAAQSDDVVIVDIAIPARSSAPGGYPARSPVPAACWNSGLILRAPMRSGFFRATRNSSFIALAECARRWRPKPRMIWD